MAPVQPGLSNSSQSEPHVHLTVTLSQTEDQAEKLLCLAARQIFFLNY